MSHIRTSTRDNAAPSPRSWSGPTIALHWASAALIVALLALGWFMVHGDLAASTKFDLYQLHKSLGFVSAGLLLLRLGARLVWPSPAPPHQMPNWERRGAGLAHAAFYVLLAVAAVSGWLLVSAATIAIPTRFFDLFVVPTLVSPDAALSSDMTFLHATAALIIVSLIALHVAAAVKHHFVDRDDVLLRMIGRR